MDQAPPPQSLRKEIAIASYDMVLASFVLISVILIGTAIVWLSIVNLNFLNPNSFPNSLRIATVVILVLPYLWVLLGYWRSKREVDELKSISNHNASQLRRTLVELQNWQQIFNELQGPVTTLNRDLEVLDQSDPAVISAKTSANTLAKMICMYAPFNSPSSNTSKSRMKFDKIYLRKWLINQSSTFVMKAKKQGLEFSLDVGDNNLPHVVMTDSQSLLRLISNLVNIAILKTHNIADRTVTCHVGKYSDNSLVIRVSNEIRNNPVDNSALLAVTKEMTLSSAKDLGFEMVIVKNIADEMGGNVRYMKNGADLVVSVFLPYKTEDKPINAYKIARKWKEGSFSTVNILIVGGDKERARSLSNELMDTFSPNSIEILNVATKNSIQRLSVYPDLIVMDHNLPNTSGIEFLRELKVNPITKNAAVIVCSSSTIESDKTDYLNTGAFAYLQKPIQNKLITETLHEAMCVTLAGSE